MASGPAPETPVRRSHRHRILSWVGYLVAWLVLAALIGSAFFLESEREVNLAGHEATLEPSVSGRVVLLTGPVLPDLRMDSGSRLGIRAVLGKTNVDSTRALVDRYALIAGNPDGVRATLEHAVEDMALDAAVRGLMLGMVPVLAWVLVGRRRRHELVRDLLRTRDGVVVLLAVLLLVVGLWQPWAPQPDTERRRWVPVTEFLAGTVVVPRDLRGIEVSGDVLTGQTRRLLQSIVESYERGQAFYADLAEQAVDLPLREPAEDETVAVLVSDRHDNVGMDAVARAVAEAAGATAVLDAGDDTSTGSRWEAFSLDSLDAAFEEYDGRWMVAGNHDHGDFVADYLAERGWRPLAGEVVTGPGDSRLLGDSDPRSSGLGIWRDQSGRSFEDVAADLAETACESEEAGERVNTLLVHDPNMGREALRRGCVDLVVGGHLHTQLGPTAVVGQNGRRGYSFTTGTTGGAAYAIAIGSKIRRTAQITLITYRDGRPAGIQPVLVHTDGRFQVDPFVPLELDEAGPDDGAEAEAR